MGGGRRERGREFENPTRQGCGALFGKLSEAKGAEDPNLSWRETGVEWGGRLGVRYLSLLVLYPLLGPCSPACYAVHACHSRPDLGG